MSAALNEEKDHHDLVVEAQMRRIRERAEAMDDSRQRIYHVPQYVDSSSPVSGSSRVLGGKADADALLARIRDLQREQMTRYHRQVGAPDAENSDGPSGTE